MTYVILSVAVVSVVVMIVLALDTILFGQQDRWDRQDWHIVQDAEGEAIDGTDSSSSAGSIPGLGSR